MPNTKAENQRAWRARAPRSITVHLPDEQLAVLDGIAAALWLATPHDPASGQGTTGRPPSRATAITALIEAQRSGCLEALPRLQAAEEAPRELVAGFWRKEAAWRRVTPASYLTRTNAGEVVRAPRPPWEGTEQDPTTRSSNSEPRGS